MCLFPLNHKSLLVCHCVIAVVQCTTCETEHGSPASRVNPNSINSSLQHKAQCPRGGIMPLLLRTVVLVLMCVIQYNSAPSCVERNQQVD